MAQEINIHPLDLETDVAIGIKLNTANPAGKMPGRIFDLSYTTLEQAKTNLFCLLLTSEGERVMHPDYGCSLNRILFEPITKSLPSKISKVIQDKVKYWLPYLDLIDIRVQVQEDQHVVEIYVKFALQGNKFDTDSITFQINLPA